MTAPKRAGAWELCVFDDGRPWYLYSTPLVCYCVSQQDNGRWQAFWGEQLDGRAGPQRASQEAAFNDCKRHAKKVRAALVKFGAAKP